MSGPYDRKVEVWISSRHSIPQNLLDDLEALLNSSSAKDAPHNGTEARGSRVYTGLARRRA